MKRLLFVVLLCALPGACRYWYKPVPVANAIGEDSTVFAGDTMHVYREPRYELYGPDEQSVYDGYEQMNRAYRAYERLFGDDPRRLAVLLATDSSLSIDSGAVRALRARGFRFVRYVRPKPQYQRYGTLAYGGVRWPLAPTVGRLLLVHFARTHAGGTVSSDSAALARFPVWYRAAVMHLIGEAGAIANDLEHVRDERESLLPFSTLLTLVRSPSQDALLDPSLRDDADALSRMIAAEGSTLAQYLVEHEGPKVMRNLALGYLGGGGLREVLGEFNSVPHSVEDIEARWRAWVATQQE